MIDIIKNTILKSEQQEITFEEYMTLALYHPELGYYNKSKQKIGKDGDFITSSNISTVFGVVFARVLETAIRKENLPFHICEIGGGNGRFAKAILDEMKKRFPHAYDRLTYIIIETSPYHRKLQQDILPIGEKVVQFESLSHAKETYSSFQGIIISNELFDAFPVRVIEKRNDTLSEVKVSVDEKGELIETVTLLRDSQIKHYLETQKITLANHQRFEVPLAMINYLEQLGEFLEKGIVFTVDYGYTNEEWMLPEHRKGSLRGYYQHQMVKNPLKHPGDMDLTTHISFDALVSYGKTAKLNFVEKLRQDEFLVAAGILDYLQDNYDSNPFSEVSKQNRAIRSLIMSGGMSQAFHVIVQEKGTSTNIEEILHIGK